LAAPPYSPEETPANDDVVGETEATVGVDTKVPDETTVTPDASVGEGEARREVVWKAETQSSLEAMVKRRTGKEQRRNERRPAEEKSTV